MAAQQQTDAWEEVRAIHKSYKSFYQISGRGLLILAVLVIGVFRFQNDSGFEGNIFSESWGILVTVLVLDWLAERREERRAEKELKARLVMEAGSQSNETAKRAIHELGVRGWLTGEYGLLKGANMGSANLQAANLIYANLQVANLANATLRGANLIYTNLQGANLMSAKLQGANLDSADLQGASLHIADLQSANLRSAKLQAADLFAANLQAVDLSGANLQGANLLDVNLKNVNLTWAKLQGANLNAANLQGANVDGVTFDENTTVPDGSKWTPDTDMKRFTDRQHPQFWRADERQSPAYRGKGEGG